MRIGPTRPDRPKIRIGDCPGRRAGDERGAKQGAKRLGLLKRAANTPKLLKRGGIRTCVEAAARKMLWDGGSEGAGRQEGGWAPIVAVSDTAPVVQTAEYDLDAAAASIAALVVSDRLVTRSTARDAGFKPLGVQSIPEPVNVIAASPSGGDEPDDPGTNTAPDRKAKAGQVHSRGADSGGHIGSVNRA